eukprot:4038393-Prymnesium_polylepis.1
MSQAAPTARLSALLQEQRGGRDVSAAIARAVYACADRERIGQSTGHFNQALSPQRRRLPWPSIYSLDSRLRSQEFWG